MMNFVIGLVVHYILTALLTIGAAVCFGIRIQPLDTVGVWLVLMVLRMTLGSSGKGGSSNG